MRTRSGIVAAVLGLLLAVPAGAQTPNYKATVVAARATYAALSGPQRAFCIVNRVAWDLRREGGGLFFKPGGTNVQERSIDIVMLLPDGHTYDVLGDAEGRAVPSWTPTKPTGRGDIRKWRAPVDPATAPGCTAGPPPDPPDVPVLCPPDQAAAVAELQGQVATLRAATASLETERARLDTQLHAWDARLQQSEADKAALQQRLDGVTCRARLLGVNVPCQVVR